MDVRNTRGAHYPKQPKRKEVFHLNIPGKYLQLGQYGRISTGTINMVILIYEIIKGV